MDTDLISAGFEQVVDREINLWVYRGQFDWHTTYEQFGYVLGLHAAQSSQQYKDLVNAVFDALVEGTTARAVQAALSAIADVPIFLPNPSHTCSQVITRVESIIVSLYRKCSSPGMR